MFAVLWDNSGDVNGRFFPYFAQLETISISRCSKKAKGMRESENCNLVKVVHQDHEIKHLIRAEFGQMFVFQCFKTK